MNRECDNLVKDETPLSHIYIYIYIYEGKTHHKKKSWKLNCIVVFLFYICNHYDFVRFN